LTPHVGVSPPSKLRHCRVAWLTERAFKKIVVILTGGVIQFDQNTRASAEETALLFLSPGESPRCFDWSFVDHDDDSGRA
jgi:hypothetical protein